MENRIREIYSEAKAGITDKWTQYMKDQNAYVKDLQDAYWSAKNAGLKAEVREIGKQLGVAKAERTLKNDQYKQMVAQTTERLAHVNEVALAYINDRLPEIYEINYNQAAETAHDVGMDFTLVNEDVVKRLITDGDIQLPKKKMNIPKDMRWNTKQLNSSVLQGILQGESMDNIAKRILPIVGNNVGAAIRNARTMVTGAENRGRQDSYERLQDDGLVLKKVWMATPDGRTRDWHIDMDGQEVEVNQYFIDGLGNELEYPGDPGGAPETVYNCFIGETSVAVNSDVVRTYKHEYDGDLITIKTAGGVEFTCTPNHPILTLNGWVHANLLNESGNILVTFIGDERTLRSNPDVNHVFARFDAVHELFDKGICQRARALDVNFHGDIPTADVEIVTEERFLRDNRNVGGSKLINKFLFKSSDVPFSGDSTLMEHFGGVGKPTLGDVSGEGKAFPLFGGSLRHPEIHGLRPVAWGDSGFFKPIDDNGSCDTIILGECLNGFTGMVFADEIVYVNVVRSHAFVYNLQSENGYYYVNNIIAENGEKNNGIMAIAKNCRCTMVTDVIGFRREDGSISKIEYEEEGGSLHDRQMAEEKTRRDNAKPEKEKEIFNAEQWLDRLNKQDLVTMDSWTDEWLNNINDSEREGVITYTSSAFTKMNGYLRGLRSDAGGYENAIEQCTAALDKASLPESTIARRGSDRYAVDGMLGKGAYDAIRSGDSARFIGAVVNDKGFLSTSPDPRGGFDDDVEFVINVPQGSHAMYVDKISAYQGEHELLLQKDSYHAIEHIQVGDYGEIKIFMSYLK